MNASNSTNGTNTPAPSSTSSPEELHPALGLLYQNLIRLGRGALSAFEKYLGQRYGVTIPPKRVQEAEIGLSIASALVAHGMPVEPMTTPSDRQELKSDT